METKQCTKCRQEKPATREFFHVYNDDCGLPRLRARCIDCVCEYTRQHNLKKFASEDRLTVKHNWCELRIVCETCGLDTPHWFRPSRRRKCQACEAVRRYPDRERPDFSVFRAQLMLAAESKYLRQYCSQNKCQSCGIVHAYDETRHKRWRHLCIACTGLHKRIYRQRHKAKKNDSIGKAIRDALRRSGESPKVRTQLGYTISQLRTHLEQQFLPGMGWENMQDWHIDHIIPQAAFDLSDPGQWRKCWCMSNLRPMWSQDNIAKSARLEFLL